MPALILAAGLALLASCTFDLDYDKYAIVYGISYYPNYTDLSSTVDDANEVNDLLVSQGFQVTHRITDDDEVTDLVPADPPSMNEASYSQLERDFQYFAEPGRLDLDDLFIFYFSGHGTQISAGSSENTPDSDPEDEAIVLIDAVWNDSDSKWEPMSEAFLTDDQMAQLLRTIPCARKVVILDSCYSGGFVSNPLEGDAIPPDYSHEGPKGLFESLGDAIYLYTNFQDYGSDISPDLALVIAASGEQDVAYEDDDNGIMTGFLLESATKADYNFDGYITVSESYFYIYRNIIEHFNMVYGPSGFAFFPDISGGPVDYILFTK